MRLLPLNGSRHWGQQYNYDNHQYNHTEEEEEKDEEEWKEALKRLDF